MLAYISQNADNRILEALKKEGFTICPLSPLAALRAPTDTHADMLLTAVENTVFVHKDYPAEIAGFEKVIKIDEPMGERYPNDVALNIAIVGRHAFANTKHASKTVLKYLTENEFSVHHVAQGYAHCSTLIVNENAIITADASIASSAREAGIDVLKINEGHIALPPYDYGFIGGASGATQSTVYFCGSLNHHPDGKSIREFCKKHGKRIAELGDFSLLDIGGIVFQQKIVP